MTTDDSRSAADVSRGIAASRESDTSEVDPVEFIRRALQISPDDAAAVREDAARAEKAGPAGCRSHHGSGIYCDRPRGHAGLHHVKIDDKHVEYAGNGTN